MPRSKKVTQITLFATILYLLLGLVFDFILSDFKSPWYYLLDTIIFYFVIGIVYRGIGPSTYPESKQNKDTVK